MSREVDVEKVSKLSKGIVQALADSELPASQAGATLGLCLAKVLICAKESDSSQAFNCLMSFLTTFAVTFKSNAKEGCYTEVRKKESF